MSAAEVLPFRGRQREDYREPPSNVAAEQALLGAILINNDAYKRVAEIIQPAHFFEDLHRRVFENAAKLIDSGRPATPITIKGYLGDADLGGLTVGQYLAGLAAEATSVANARGYAAIIRDMAIRRSLIAESEKLRDRAYDAPPDLAVRTILAEHEDALTALRPSAERNAGFVRFSDLAAKAAQAAAEAWKHGGAVVGLSTGIRALDDALGGLQGDDLIVLAGRPGMGKTALATNIAFNVATRLRERGAPGNVGMFSLEMGGEQLATRTIAALAAVSAWRLRRGKADEDEVRRFIDAAHESDLPFLVDAASGLSISALCRRARDLHKRQGLVLLIVDYLQLLAGASQRARDNRVQEVTEITAGLKGLAKELGIPVIALSQLSRRVEERDDKRPQLSDLRESGSIEQDADSVLFIYREAYYLKRREPKPGTEAHMEWERAMWAAKGRAEVLIEKNRHGPGGSVEIGFEDRYTRFCDDVPDPGPEPVGPGPAHKGPKRPSLPADATNLFGCLRGLSTSTKARAPAPEELAANPGLPKGARLVTLAQAREQFRQDALGPHTEEGEVVKAFSAAFKQLKKADLAYWAGTKDEPLLWLKECVEE